MTELQNEREKRGPIDFDDPDQVKNTLDKILADTHTIRNELGSNRPWAPKYGKDDLIVYFIEEDKNEAPKLPPIDGEPRIARSVLSTAFTTMAAMNVQDVMFSRTGERQNANLIITSSNQLGNVDARLDITASGQHRITFNERKHFDRTSFEATTIHAMEGTLGYPRHKYSQGDPYFKK